MTTSNPACVTSHPWRCRWGIAILFSASLFLVPPAPAALRTWDCGAGGFGEWSNPRNWVGDVAPQAGDTLVFPPGAACVSCYDDSPFPQPVYYQLLFTGHGYAIGDSASLNGGIIASRADSTNQAPVLHLEGDQTFECSEASSELRLWRIYPATHTLTLHAVGDLWMRDGLAENVGDAATLIKTGTGTLRWQGYADREGPRSLTFQLNAGTLILSNANELRSYPALAGAVTLGDGLGGALSDVVELRTSNQISGDVTINSSGLLYLNNFANVANPGHSGMMQSLTLRGGSVAMGTGILGVQRHITALASSRTATINGKLALWIHANYDDITVADGTAHPDLIIYGSIVRASWGVRKLGPGSLTLAGANTFDEYDLFRVDEGSLTLSHDGALGTSNILTTVTNDAQLIIDGADLGPARLSFGSTEPLTASGSASWTGDVQLGSASTISVLSGIFDLRGPVSFTRLTKTGNGALRLSSSSGDALNGTLTVTAGSVELGLTSGGTFSGVLTIGDGTGGVEADRVQLLAANQLGTAADVTINSSGLLDLNGHSDQLGPLVFNGGRLQTGTGSAYLLYGLTANASSDAQARIAGRLVLDGPRTFSVASGPFSPDLVVSADIRGNGSLVKYDAGEMSLSGSNSFNATLTVREGTLDVDHDLALGNTDNGTIVEEGAVLSLRYGVAVEAESLTISGVGSGSGALRSVGGSNAWAGPVTLEDDTTIQVQLAANWLNLGGVIGGTGNLTKTGEGTLLFSGAANTYAGDTVVNEGVLELRKTGGGAIPNGQLTIGDGVGAARSDIVRLKSNSQIGAIPVRVNSSGYLDLNGYDDSFGALTLDGGTVNSGSGRLTLGGPVTALANVAGTPAIWGELALGSVGTRNIEVQATPEVPETLSISASVSGTPTLAKLGAGTLVLSGSNVYSGLTRIQEGVLATAHPLALGTTNGLTVVSNGASLLLSSGSRITNEWLTLNGAGSALHPYALGSLSGTYSWSGPLLLGTDSVISTEPADSFLTLNGAISGSGGLTKTGLGTLKFSGGASNTYTGPTRVNEGTLELAKSAEARAIAGDLAIGDGLGGPSADVVRLLDSQQFAAAVTVTIANSGRLEANGHEDWVGAVTGTGVLDLGGATTLFEVGYNDVPASFDGQIVGSGRLYKEGDSTWTLTGTNTYTGNTRLNYGTLLVNGLQPFSDVEVRSETTLGGSGTVGNIRALGGTIAPGASTGILTCSNAALLTGFYGPTTLQIELNGTRAGSDYDQLNVRGTSELGNANLDVLLGFAPQEGNSFRILNNDATDSIVGAFAGLTNGARFTVNGLPFQISYTGGTGNDVVLTVTNTVLRLAGAVAVQSGNGNGIIEPNECNTLGIMLTNRAKDAVSGITGTLTTSTPGVFVSQPFSTYPDMKGGDMGANETSFQITTTPAFTCGANIELRLTVTTAAHGTFSVPLGLTTGTAGSPVVFDSKTVTAIPDLDTIESVLSVSNLTTALIKVVVSCHITHPNDQDLDLTLIAPDGTEVVLSTDNGGTGDNYGTSCLSQNRAVFDDDSHVAITAGTAPFASRYQPEGPLAALAGKSESEINGKWLLRITDDQAGNTGTLQCWSLSLAPAACADGGGPCELCPNQTISGVIGASSLLQDRRLARDGTASSCGTAKPCPGLSGTGTRSYDACTFFNGGPSACITVALRAESDLFSAAYLESYDPTALCTRYLADRGTGTQTEPLRDYSFNVPAGASFAVVVNQVNLDDSGPYTLTVSGGDCQPVLHIRQDGTRQVVLDWSTAAAGYQLEATDTLPSRDFQPVLPLPVVTGGKNIVTNEASSASRFYRLHKP